MHLLSYTKILCMCGRRGQRALILATSAENERVPILDTIPIRGPSVSFGNQGVMSKGAFCLLLSLHTSIEYSDTLV